MNCLEIPLDIADVKIEGVECTEAGEIFVTITSTVAGTTCHVCNQEITDFYGENREIVSYCKFSCDSILVYTNRSNLFSMLREC